MNIENYLEIYKEKFLEINSKVKSNISIDSIYLHFNTVLKEIFDYFNRLINFQIEGKITLNKILKIQYQIVIAIG